MRTIYFEKNIPEILLTKALLPKKKLCIDGLITHRFPLAAWRTAVDTAKNKHSGAIKVVLDYRDAANSL